MYTREELAFRYIKFTDTELLNILYHEENYTENAILAAKDEVRRRNLSLEELTDFYETKNAEVAASQASETISLSIAEKAAWFFILGFIPFIKTGIKMGYEEQGCTKKLDQSFYYSVFGVVSLFATMIITSILNIAIIVVLWPLSFWVATKLENR